MPVQNIAQHWLAAAWSEVWLRVSLKDSDKGKSYQESEPQASLLYIGSDGLE
jgi:hypothetical protein